MGMKHWLLICCLLGSFQHYGQTLINGIVIAKNTQEPLSGVAIYLSGTSIGVISSLNGTYSINYPDGINAPLIFRTMGYETLQFPDPLNTDLSTIRMIEKPDELDVVYITEDTWSRSKKERYFRQFFLGRVPAAEEMEIINIEDVKLRFDKTTNTLSAHSNSPILVRNSMLGYDIQVDIAEFEIIFDPIPLNNITISGDSEFEKPTHFPKSSYMGITTYFIEMEGKRPSMKRRSRNRERLYDVSDLKLYRSLMENKLEENNYMLYRNRKKLEINNQVRSRKIGEYYKVSFREREYLILDKENNQTDVQISEAKTIVIDKYGNCITGRNIVFGGFLGSLHLSGMLPLDYYPE
jgi:hypothetical protein